MGRRRNHRSQVDGKRLALCREEAPDSVGNLLSGVHLGEVRVLDSLVSSQLQAVGAVTGGGDSVDRSWRLKIRRGGVGQIVVRIVIMSVVVVLFVARAAGTLSFDEVGALLIGGVRALSTQVAGFSAAIAEARLAFVAALTVPRGAAAVLARPVVVEPIIAAPVVAVVASVWLLALGADVAGAVGLRGRGVWLQTAAGLLRSAPSLAGRASASPPPSPLVYGFSLRGKSPRPPDLAT